jgi:hypothetical protein
LSDRDLQKRREAFTFATSQKTKWMETRKESDHWWKRFRVERKNTEEMISWDQTHGQSGEKW